MNATKILLDSPWDRFNQLLSGMAISSVFLIMDEHTNRFCKMHFLQNSNLNSFHETIVPAGESSKSLQNCQKIWEEWMDKGMDRHSLVICLGGGVVCDLGGFCASVFMRGVKTIYVPTSLMAMADAAIGGKTGINFCFSKNILGSFYLPVSIVIDPDFLSTLPDRQIRSGFVEIIKHSLISQPAYFPELKEETWPLSSGRMIQWIKRSIETKLHFIEDDLLDRGMRKALNFGHTIGHAIEACTFDSEEPLLHGEAVAWGMICELSLSAQRFSWKKELQDELVNWIRFFAPKYDWKDSVFSHVQSRLNSDKKKNKGEVLYSLLETPGKPILDQRITENELLNSLEYLHL